MKPSSSISSLNPTIGSGGLLKVGGRLGNSPLSSSQKHPTILHGKDPLTQLIVTSKHRSLLHAGPTLLMAALGENFHILRARRLVRSTCKRCITCRKTVATTERQLMGQLPTSRVNPAPPFFHTGMDFCGPFTIKRGHTRRPVLLKCYACVFVCFTTKAAHIELVSDLTTEAFLAALRRFVSRRGSPTALYSDNGSNFIGANNALSDIYSMLNLPATQAAISSYTNQQRISWHFTPERAPHFGGLWESLVKSLKYHLKRVVGDHHLTYEELTTVLCQIESCLNSRPLLPLYSHSEEGISVLTPGHFLIGRNMQSLPDQSLVNEKMPLLRRWSLCQSLVQHLWKRWAHEYMQQLQNFAKWREPSRNIAQTTLC